MSTTTPKVQLWLSFENVTVIALSVPLDKCRTFAVHPLKWLRYLGFAIYGREGYLSTSEAGPDINNYTAGFDSEDPNYYFISDDAPHLVDVDVVDDRTSNTSELSTRRRDFSANVIERDGTCVLTGNPARQCVACHIIPHAKGNNYMRNMVHHRGEAYSDFTNDLDNIDDTRNGLLLSNLFHLSFGLGELAFLKTPNFALTVDDVPYADATQREASPDSRITLHHFVDPSALGDLITNAAPHNTDARQPQDTSEWPPSIILDLFYAVGAINAWSPQPFIKYVRRRSKDVYYNDEDDDEDNDNVLDSSGPSHIVTQMGDQTTGQSGSGRYALRSRNKTSNVRPKEKRLADLMDGVFALWMQASRVDKPKPENDRASSLARNEDIEMWLQSVEDPTTN